MDQKSVSSWFAAACCAIMLFGSPNTNAQEAIIEGTNPFAGDASAMALSRDLSFLIAPIKNESDLKRHLKQSINSPLTFLSPPARKRFLSSLEFNESGLTTFDFSDIEAELTPSQAYQLLALFGEQHLTPSLEGLTSRTKLDAEIMSAAKAKCVDPSSPFCDIGGPIGADHKHYRCESEGTCASATNKICTSNC